MKGFELGGAIPPPLLGNKLIVLKLLSSKNTEESEFNDYYAMSNRINFLERLVMTEGLRICAAQRC